MKVFISWSGTRSNKVAKALRTFLEDVNHSIKPWMSETDIDAGARWAAELAKQLEETNFGILCLTPESLTSPWLLFEAGALSKSIQGSRVCPYLVGMSKRELQGPLAQFQCKETTAEQTCEMLQAVNEAMGKDALPQARLRKYFEQYWPALESEITNAARVAKYLPPDLLRRLVDTLCNRFSIHDLESLFMSQDLPRRLVNWQQALIYVSGEAVHVALEHDKLRAFLQAAVEERPGCQDLAQLSNELPKEIAS
jgi:hypothetical protein